MMVRKHVFIDGRVQGVYFRVYTRKAAMERGITGWVRNRWDSRVEAVFEGKKEMVKSMINWCYQGSPSSHVENVEVFDEDYKNEFEDFQIRSSS